MHFGVLDCLRVIGFFGCSLVILVTGVSVRVVSRTDGLHLIWSP